MVASEVRTLAQRADAAAKEIKVLIDASVEQVERGDKLVATAGSTIEWRDPDRAGRPAPRRLACPFSYNGGPPAQAGRHLHFRHVFRYTQPRLRPPDAV